MILKLKDLLPTHILESAGRPNIHKSGSVWAHKGSEGKYGAEYKGEIEYFHDIDRARAFAKTGSGYGIGHKRKYLNKKSEQKRKQHFEKNYRDYDEAPAFGESKKDFNEKVWRENYIHQTSGGSSIIGTAHGHKDDDEVYDKKNPDNYSIEHHVIPLAQKRVEEARKQGKKVIYLTEGGTSNKGKNVYANQGGDEQERIANAIKPDEVRTFDGEDMDISNSDAPIYELIGKETGNTKEEEQAFMFANMYGQGDESSIPAEELTNEHKNALRKNGYLGGFPPGEGNGTVKSLKGDADWEADRQLLYLMSYPGDYDGYEKNYKLARKKYGDKHLRKLLNGKARKSAKAFNKVRDNHLDQTIKEIESDGDTIAIVTPGAGHAYSMGDVVR